MGEIILVCQGRASIIQSVFIKGSQEGKKMEEAEVRVMWSHEPRNLGSL